MNVKTLATNSFSCYLCDKPKARLVVANAEYTYLQCSSCGFRRLHPLPTADEEDHLYEDEYYFDRGLESDLDHQSVLMRSLIESRVKTLTELNRGPGRLLDLGAGTGLFVEASLRAGWKAQGLETSAAAVRIASTITRAPVALGRLEDALFDDLFDAITLWDVLEHVPDPRATLETVRGLLRPRGLVGISLPNVAGVKARLRGNRWRYYQRSFGHISHFSTRTVAELFKQAGYVVERLDTTGSFNLGKPFGLDPNAVRERHPRLNGAQSIADRAVGRLGLGESLVAFARFPKS
jgi:2-polyprenyl-3-methyl-5-hydroxy-6-metoxy-1,4-benzoquinol methylase